MKKLVGFLTVATIIGFAYLIGVNYQQSDSKEQLWTSYKLSNSLAFDQDVQMYRQMVFMRNLAIIQSHNANKDKSFEMGVNQFSHLSTSQFDLIFSNKRIRDDYQQKFNSQNVKQFNNPSNDIDWQKQGKVTPVKNQGQCDAGYAFCSNSLAQSYSLMNKVAITLSEQNIVDCAQNYTTFGCSGGSRSGTLKFLQQKGVTTQAKYPWIGVKQSCKNLASQFRLPDKLVTVNGCNDFKSQLMASPLTVAVNTTNWQFYKSGVLQLCGSEVNHDILLVGFSEAAWRLKNSWGVRWGEYGYVRLRMGDTCGICSKPGFGFKV